MRGCVFCGPSKVIHRTIDKLLASLAAQLDAVHGMIDALQSDEEDDDSEKDIAHGSTVAY